MKWRLHKIGNEYAIQISRWSLCSRHLYEFPHVRALLHSHWLRLKITLEASNCVDHSVGQQQYRYFEALVLHFCYSVHCYYPSYTTQHLISVHSFVVTVLGECLITFAPLLLMPLTVIVALIFVEFTDSSWRITHIDTVWPMMSNLPFYGKFLT